MFEIDAEAGQYVAAHQAERWAGKLGRFVASSKTSPPTAVVSRILSSVFRGYDRASPHLLEIIRDTRDACPACSILVTITRRESELLLAALADAPTARRYEASLGICLRHLRSLPRPDAQGLVRSVLVARLRLLHWELEETFRKQDWSFRHEEKGPESTAWLRAPAALDGRVFLGALPGRVVTSLG